MMIALLLAAAQPAPLQPDSTEQPPAPTEAIDITASVIAYRDWRLCLDSRLGRPPRPRPPGEAELERALEACRSHEDALRTANVAAFGAEQGGELFASATREARAEIAAPARKR